MNQMSKCLFSIRLGKTIHSDPCRTIILENPINPINPFVIRLYKIFFEK